MTYRRSQRSDKHGSFPEPPFERSSDGDSTSVESATTRFRRSLGALRCLARRGKHNRQANHSDHATSYFHSALGEVEDSWESTEATDDFEIRTSSPPRSEYGDFDVSKALHSVPESLEEEEEEQQQQEEGAGTSPEKNDAGPGTADDIASQSSKPSDYSSEFMTDDSTETSGLPWESSFSQHGSADTTEDESRIGIRPFQLPLMLDGKLTVEDHFIVESDKGHDQIPTHKSDPGTAFDRTAYVEKGVLRSPSATSLPENKVPLPTKSTQVQQGQAKASLKSSSSSDTYSDEMRDVLELFSETLSTKKSLAGSGTTMSVETESFSDHLSRTPNPSHDTEESNLGNLLAVQSTTDSVIGRKRNASSQKIQSRVKELIKKFGEKSGEEPEPIQRSLDDKYSRNSRSSDCNRSESLGVPSEIIRHDFYDKSESKGFFWRSRPAIWSETTKNNNNTTTTEDDLVDTSISTTEGNRSMDYSDVFSQEELEREYSAPGEPPYIHI